MQKKSVYNGQIQERAQSIQGLEIDSLVLEPLLNGIHNGLTHLFAVICTMTASGNGYGIK
jgi:hypothetical protein